MIYSSDYLLRKI